jgi:hypothetical protein
MVLVLGLIAGFVLGLKAGITLGHSAERRKRATGSTVRAKGDVGYVEG